MPQALVDVLIPVFNGAAYLRSSIASIQNQTVSDICIHVVDDGSTDGTGAILAEMAAQDSRIRVHSQPNGGIVNALNAGLSHCTAEFVARHDADDLAYTQRFQEQLDLLRSRPDVVAVGGSARHINKDGAYMGTIAKFPPTENADTDSVPAKEPYLLHPFLMIRRDKLVEAGGYRDVIHSEDTDLYWRLQEHGELFSDVRIQGEYRVHPDSISSRSVSNGRIMAISSQLSALSAKRRRSGEPDLRFTRESGADLKANAGSLDEALKVAERQLTPVEARHLRFSVGIKLLEMTSYRPYELEMSDCVFLRRVFEESASSLEGPAKGVVLRNYSGAAARLATRGKWAQARVLLFPGMLLPFWSRFAIRVFMPPPVHRRVRRAVGPILFLLRKA